MQQASVGLSVCIVDCSSKPHMQISYSLSVLNAPPHTLSDSIIALALHAVDFKCKR